MAAERAVTCSNVGQLNNAIVRIDYIVELKVHSCKLLYNVDIRLYQLSTLLQAGQLKKMIKYWVLATVFNLIKK